MTLRAQIRSEEHPQPPLPRHRGAVPGGEEVLRLVRDALARGVDGLEGELLAAHVEIARLRADLGRAREEVERLAAQNDSLHEILDRRVGLIEERAMWHASLVRDLVRRPS